jgi:hypothetical protein
MKAICNYGPLRASDGQVLLKATGFEYRPKRQREDRLSVAWDSVTSIRPVETRSPRGTFRYRISTKADEEAPKEFVLPISPVQLTEILSRLAPSIAVSDASR